MVKSRKPESGDARKSKKLRQTRKCRELIGNIHKETSETGQKQRTKSQFNRKKKVGSEGGGNFGRCVPEKGKRKTLKDVAL